MNNLLNILREAQKNLFCPVCKRRYDIAEIKLKGFFDNIYLLQTECANNHQPVNLSIIVYNNQSSDLSKKTNINNNFSGFNQQIDNFNGDFESIWK